MKAVGDACDAEMSSMNSVLQGLLKSSHNTIVGFGISGDLLKLSASFPSMSCFQEVYNVVDLSPLSRVANPSVPPADLTSLHKTTQVELGLSLNKGQQMSLWDKRPLTEAQIEVRPSEERRTGSTITNNLLLFASLIAVRVRRRSGLRQVIRGDEGEDRRVR